MQERSTPLPAGADEPDSDPPSGDHPTSGTHPAWCARDDCEPGRAGVALHAGEASLLEDDDWENGFRSRIRTSLMRHDDHRAGEHRTYVNMWAWDGTDDGEEPRDADHFEGWLTLAGARRLRDRLTELLETAEAGGVRLDPEDPEQALIEVAARVLRDSMRGAAEDVLKAAGLVGVSRG